MIKFKHFILCIIYSRLNAFYFYGYYLLLCTTHGDIYKLLSIQSLCVKELKYVRIEYSQLVFACKRQLISVVVFHKKQSSYENQTENDGGIMKLLSQIIACIYLILILNQKFAYQLAITTVREMMEICTNFPQLTSLELVGFNDLRFSTVAS